MAAPPNPLPEGELASWNAPASKDPSETVWAGAAKKKKKPAPDPNRPRMARWKRITLWSAGSVLGILLLVLLLTPIVAGWLAPGFAAAAAAKQISGQVRVEGTSFSWLGGQTIGPVIITDPAKPSSEVARLKIEASPGLLALATGALGSGPDLGTVRISGKARIVRSPDGTTNLERALAPPKAAKPQPKKTGPARPAQLPRALQGKVIITDLDASYTDETPGSGLGTVQIKDIRVDAALSPASGPSGAGATLRLVAKTLASQAGSPEGSLKIDADIDSLTNTNGLLQPQKARIDAHVRTQGLPVPVIDALAGLGGRLGAALGPALDVELAAKGSLKNAQADWKITSRHASVTGAVAVADSVVTTSTPIMVNLQGHAVRALADLDKTLDATGTLRLSQVPDLTLSVDSLRLKIPSGAPDLRGAAARISLKTTETKGTVRLLPDAAADADQFAVAPFSLTLDAPDLAGPVKVQGATNATIDGKPAGNLTIDVTASGLLDRAGAPKAGLPDSVEGIVRLHNVATAIAQPFVQALKIDLPADIGPTLNVDARATTAQGPAPAPGTAPAAGALPPVNLDVFITGQRLDVKAGLMLADNTLRSREQGITVKLDSAGAVASRFVDPSTGWSLGKTGTLNIAVRDIAVPLKDGAPVLDQAKGAAQVALAGFSAVPTARAAAAGGPIEITSIKLGAALAPGAPPKVSLDSALSYRKQAFTATGALDVPGLYAVGRDGALAVTPMEARPAGTIEIKNIPTALAAAFTPEPAPTAPAPGAPPAGATGAKPAPAPQPAPAPPLDLARLAAETVGPTLGVTLMTESSKTLAKGLDVNLAIRAERLSSEAKASVSTERAALNGLTAATTIAPGTLDTLLATFAPDLTPRPRLAAPSKVILKVDPVSIPLVQDGAGKISPDLARVADATVRLELPDQTLVQNIVLKNADGTTQDLGTLGVEGVDVRATVPVAAALVPQARWLKPFSGAIRMRVLDGPNSRAMTVAVDAEGQLAGAQGSAASVESAAAKIAVTEIVPKRLERLAGKPGMLTGALGDSASLKANIALRQAEGAPAGGAKPPPIIDADALLSSPLVSMAQPLKVSVLPDRIRSDAPVEIRWRMLPEFANAFVFAPAPAKPGQAPQPTARLENPVEVTVTLNKFAIATGTADGKPVGPLKPGIFDAALSAAIPSFEMSMPDRSRLKTTNLRAALQTTAPLQAAPGAPPDVAFQVNVDDVGLTLPAGAAPAPSVQKLALNGTVSNLSDALGNVTADKAALTASGDLPVIPTALIDALAKQDGMLVEALGPVCAVTIRAERFGAAGGTLDLHARSARATAHVKGNVDQKTFVSTEPITASLSEITNELAKRLVKGLPMIGSVQKNPQDEPAVFTASEMKIPLDNDMARLNGVVVVDPGQARFTTSGAFGKILSGLGQKSMGEIGQRLEPLKVNIKNGVATYERWSFPLGEFKVQTEGTVDLVKRTIDVLTYLPIGALSDDAARLFKAQSGAAAALGLADTFMVPWRTRGTFENHKTEPDFDLFAKDLAKSIKPQDLIKKGLEDALKKKAPAPGKK